MRKLLKASKAIKAHANLMEKIKRDMNGCVIWFTASAGECRAVNADHPNFLLKLDPDVADAYKDHRFLWTICTVILDRDIVSNRFNLDVTEYQETGTYFEIMDVAYHESISDVDSMNRRRRKNIAIFVRMGDHEFSEEFIDKLIAVDKEFYESEGLITEKDKHQERLELARKLERAL